MGCVIDAAYFLWLSTVQGVVILLSDTIFSGFRKKTGRKVIMAFIIAKILVVVIVLMLLFTFINGLLNIVIGFLGMEDDAKQIDIIPNIPAHLVELYQEAEEEFEVKWTLLAAIHAIQTEFAESKPFFKNDALDLPDPFWNSYQESYDRYWALKRAEENYERSLDSCSRLEEAEDRATCSANASEVYRRAVEAAMKIKPDRGKIEDLIYTVAMFLQGIDYESETKYWLIQDHIYEITWDYEKTETVKLFVRLYDMMYQRPGWPISIRYNTSFITSPFGERTDPFDPDKIEMHEGVDFAPPMGTPVFSFADGVVTYAGPAGGYGTLIIIEHEDYERKDGHIETIRTYYGHNQNVRVRTGMKVVGGQKIAEIGNEGDSTGPHLHLEVQIKPSFFSDWEAVDPMPWLITPEEYEEIENQH